MNPLESGTSLNRGASCTRAHIVVRGIVQGVGFRPFIHRIAHAHQLTGWVLNSTEGVEIEVEGQHACIREFLDDLSNNPPPLASIHQIDVHHLPPVGYSSFIIEISHEDASGLPLVSPDIATCPDCLSELFDVRDRRFRYPFINCTNCGPRFTILEGTPYDRPRTTMKVFTMCSTCQEEYDTPSNRRFHAQPNACSACGPTLWLWSSNGVWPDGIHNVGTPCDGARNRGIDERVPLGTGGVLPAASLAGIKPADPDALDVARKLLKAGQVLAIKGLGGFHLACDATNADAVRRLRVRKLRVEKPFAIMVRDLATARRLCYLDDAEAQLLASARRPIVLLERRQEGAVASEVAPHNKRLGVMLPYTPIHHLLFEPTEDVQLDALVMTSGNLSEEPIAKDNEEALARLGSLADYFLLHDRPIHIRCDDSVTQVLDGKEMLIRRSRGYVPLPVRLDFELEPVLACGAELKNTFCIAKDNYAFLSQHIGDMENQETLDFFAESVDHMIHIFNLHPRVVAHDLHPDYLSTRYALSYLPESTPSPSTSVNVVAVQHHHAHVASCMAENGLAERVIGVAFDGTGYGLDGTIWGGEFLVADYLGFERVAHLKRVPLPGGEAAIRKPYRTAVSYLLSAYGNDLPRVDLVASLDPDELEVLKTQIAKNINSPMTSSCGRLFDAVSALLGICREITYEGQAAIELEMAAEDDVVEAYEFELAGGKALEIHWTPVIRSIVADLLRGERCPVIAARFHNGVAQMIAEVCGAIRRNAGPNRVCLSGGVFQNRFLLSRTLNALRRDGFETYTHHLVPCNDGGVSLGQAVVASARVRANKGLICQK